MVMYHMNDAGRRVKSADKSFAILDCLYQHGGGTVTDVAEEIGVAKSTAHAHMATLEDHEFLVERGDEYHVSLKFLEFGIQARKDIGLKNHARRTLEEVAKETGESVGLFVEEHGRLVYIDAADGERSVRTHGNIGTRSYLHDSAAGKAILAYLPRERVEDVIDTDGLPAQTEHTITDHDTLFEELREVREADVAFNDSETLDGVRAVASPILVDGEVLGSVGVAGPENRLAGSRYRVELPEIVRGATNEIELRVSGATS